MISGIGNSSSLWMMARPSSAQMVSDLFSKLDTKNQGYLEESDLEAAFSSIATDDSSLSVSELFSQLDSDGDGKVTESEMSSSLEQLSAQLDAGFNNMRTTGMEAGMPPPPPPMSQSEDEGFTLEELTAQLEEIDSTDSARYNLVSSIVSNFDEADADGDGKVSMQEAMTYAQSTQSTTAADSSTTTVSAVDNQSATVADDTTQAEVLRRIMQLMDAYRTSDTTTASLVSALSISV